jgi:carbon storage regulator
MLVLTRKVEEEIVISGNIHIKVVDIRGGKVRIGIVAPGDVIVDRQEIHEKRLKMFNERPNYTFHQPVS